MKQSVNRLHLSLPLPFPRDLDLDLELQVEASHCRYPYPYLSRRRPSCQYRQTKALKSSDWPCWLSSLSLVCVLTLEMHSLFLSILIKGKVKVKGED